MTFLYVSTHLRSDADLIQFRTVVSCVQFCIIHLVLILISFQTIQYLILFLSHSVCVCVCWERNVSERVFKKMKVNYDLGIAGRKETTGNDAVFEDMKNTKIISFFFSKNFVILFCGKSVGLHVVQSSPLKTYFHIDKLPLSTPSINTSAKYCASEILVLHTSCACILDTVLSASREREKKRKKSVISV